MPDNNPPTSATSQQHTWMIHPEHLRSIHPVTGAFALTTQSEKSSAQIGLICSADSTVSWGLPRTSPTTCLPLSERVSGSSSEHHSPSALEETFSAVVVSAFHSSQDVPNQSAVTDKHRSPAAVLPILQRQSPSLSTSDESAATPVSPQSEASNPVTISADAYAASSVSKSSVKLPPLLSGPQRSSLAPFPNPRRAEADSSNPSLHLHTEIPTNPAPDYSGTPTKGSPSSVHHSESASSAIALFSPLSYGHPFQVGHTLLSRPGTRKNLQH